MLLSLYVSIPTQAQSQRALDLDCADFPSQRAAQNYYNDHPGDPDGLDSEGDGRACESLPCPCYFGSADPAPDPTPTPPKPKPEPKPSKSKAVIIKVIKGDAVKVRLLPGGPKVGVQLLGVMAPGLTSCGGKESKQALKTTLPRRTVVWIASDLAQPNRKSGRLLRYVDKPSGGKDAGLAQIVRGYAKAASYIPRRFDRRDKYQANEKSARVGLRGNWAIC